MEVEVLEEMEVEVEVELELAPSIETVGVSSGYTTQDNVSSVYTGVHLQAVRGT